VNVREILPTPVRNAWNLTFGEGIEPAQHTPAEVVYDEPHRLLKRFVRPGSESAAEEVPVLLVPPLAAPATCFDLRPGQSLAEFLLDTGRTPYVIDYGTMSYADRGLGFEDWIDDIIPTAIRAVSAEHGGKPIDVVCWCLGGTLTLLSASAHSDLPLRSIATVATPIDYAKLPTLYVLRGLAQLTGGKIVGTGTKLMGGLPSPIVRLSFRATAWSRELKKPWFVARNLSNTETLARMESVERFMGSMPGYPGRFYQQLWSRIIVRNDLGKGGMRLGNRKINFSDLKVPVLAVAGSDDVITTVPAARHLTNVLTGAPFVRFEVERGSHLGVLTGPDAKSTTWAHIDAFLTEQQAS
jgi:polyhydroxyalkanoate synthase